MNIAESVSVHSSINEYVVVAVFGSIAHCGVWLTRRRRSAVRVRNHPIVHAVQVSQLNAVQVVQVAVNIKNILFQHSKGMIWLYLRFNLKDKTSCDLYRNF